MTERIAHALLDWTITSARMIVAGTLAGVLAKLLGAPDSLLFFVGGVASGVVWGWWMRGVE